MTKHLLGISQDHRLARFMIRNRHRVITRNEAFDYLWPEEPDASDHTRKSRISSQIQRSNEFLAAHGVPWIIGSMLGRGLIAIHETQLDGPMHEVPVWDHDCLIINDPAFADTPDSDASLTLKGYDPDAVVFAHGMVRSVQYPRSLEPIYERYDTDKGWLPIKAAEYRSARRRQAWRASA